MSEYNKSAPKRDGGYSASKGAGKTPGYRGNRPTEGGAGAGKQRWTSSDRSAAPAGDRKPFRGRDADGGRPATNDRRPNWEPREKPAYAPRGERPSYGNTDRPARGNSERPSYGDRPQRSNTDRPSYGDRPARSNSDRPSYGDRPARGNSDRPSYGDRPARGNSERPSYGDRPARSNSDRPSYGDRPARSTSDRPAYGDRPARSTSDRPAYGDRPARTERPSYGDRPATSDRNERTSAYGDRDRDRSDRNARTERPSYDRPARTERPSYGDRPATSDRNERTSYSDRNDRGARTERPSYGDRPARRDFSERPERRTSDFYPNRDAGTKSFAPQDDVVLERLEADAIQAVDVEGVTFGDLGLGANIVRQLNEMGAPSPFPIQAATIPDVLAGKDVLGRGKTGSGKTIAFGAPLVERLMENNGGKDRQIGRKPRALILAPTRELALQIDRTVQPIARSVGLFTTQIYGGVPQYKQVSALQRGVDIIVGTPGRIEDLIAQGKLDLSQVVVTVLDEADHMCDLGFLEPVQRILNETKADSQRLLFSATLDKGVATLVKQFLKNPAVHEVAGEDQASSTIDHRVLLIEQRDKTRIIEELASGTNGKTLVFARTRAFAEQLAEQLEDAGIGATSLHGDLNQSRRTRNLQLLTSGRVSVMVATDVAARGIHVDDITLVIQADAPDEYKTYLHRSGRTGRAGKQGTVVTLVSKARRRRMDELLQRAEIKATVSNAAPGDNLIRDLAAL
ncbi:superfamily II DNA/RNA helicase [Glaciihabitans tibetensis]|uniref:Superfamily II DNA/RNA helicase n=1 Tax=Glaciihabitans tibetensis TaxID=1266600 RepID=A0A2T0VB16_9MICO|nr:DEAD/DEAH box helicase [Glaciihabitans tibetensis]PRY67400.1 superfamily II DNA/RNA helicase [Glaciihabitans tibetensis]